MLKMWYLLLSKAYRVPSFSKLYQPFEFEIDSHVLLKSASLVIGKCFELESKYKISIYDLLWIRITIKDYMIQLNLNDWISNPVNAYMKDIKGLVYLDPGG